MPGAQARSQSAWAQIMPPLVRRLILALLPASLVARLRSLRCRAQRAACARNAASAEIANPQLTASLTAPPASPLASEWEMVPDNDATWNAHAGWSHQSIVQTQLSKWAAFLRSVAGPQPLGQSH